MNNPWLKKNPFLSMWLSGANAMLGFARGLVGAQLQRQGRAAATEMSKAMVAAPLSPPKARRTATKTRKKR